MAMICTSAMSGVPFSDKLQHLKLSASSSFKPLLRNLHQSLPLLQIDESCRRFGEASGRLLDNFVDHVFDFVDEPLLQSQKNFAPVEEIGESVDVFVVEGRIPDDFQEGVYIRNGSNPLFGGFKSGVSVFGKTSSVWIEGEGMLHAVYFKRGNNGGGKWTAVYTNKYVETETFKLEKERNRPCFLPAVEGDAPAVIASFLLNLLRFGMPDKQMSNTNIIEHAGRFYSVAENYVPQEIDITTLETLGNWDFDGVWTRPFTSHPKRAPVTGELVTIGNAPQKPHCVLGVISADGKKLIHEVDLELKRGSLIHEIGVTNKYNVIMDFPLVVDLNRVIRGGPLIKFEEEGYARIGVMPRFGNADSIKWFQVETCSAFHIINCFEDEDEVIVMACRARKSIIPGPDLGKNKLEWFSRGLKHINLVQENNEDDQDGKLFSQPYEWRLNTKTGEVKEGHLTGTEFAMDFPMIHPDFVGVGNKYAYTQLVDSAASTVSGMAKFGGLAKLHLQERNGEVIKVEHHMFPKNTFCSGATFVAKCGSVEEDDGWIITFVHDEDMDSSQFTGLEGTNVRTLQDPYASVQVSCFDSVLQCRVPVLYPERTGFRPRAKNSVYIVDAKHFPSEPIAKIAMPNRVPYGFHGLFTKI